MSSTNSLKHGMYASRAVAIDRGRFAEDPDEVAALIDGMIEALRPRNALEHEVAYRIALAAP